jgi:uncharacterized protein YjbI with pentapeptide repeats
MSKSTKESISSQEAKDRLRAGEELRDLRIDRLTLTKVEIDFAIQIVDCEIGILDFNNSVLKEDVTIRRCRVDMCVLSEARIEKKLDFKRTAIGRGRFQRVDFQGIANFAETTLAYSSFHQSTFCQKADFGRGTFIGDATFSEVTFKDMANFIHCEFKERGIFLSCIWRGKVDFKHIQVAKDLELNQGQFYDELLLMGAVVQLSVSLNGAYLEGRTDFSSMSAGRSLSLVGVSLGESQGFRFVNAIAHPIVLERDTVEGHIWPERNGEYLTAAREYGFLRTAFAQINRFDDEDWAYYQFKRNERLAQPFSANPLQLLMRGGNFLFLDLGCGYGTRPFRTLLVIALMLFFFGIFYFFGAPVPPDVHYGLSLPLWNQTMHALYTSLLAFSGSIADTNVSGGLRLLAMIEYMMGVVFMGLFIVAFSRKVIR